MPTYKLGKAPAKIDKRTIRLTAILKKTLPPLPAEFDVDASLNGLVDNNMFGNDQLGDCVIAGRAHQTLRFEKYEQHLLIPITDAEVQAEYFAETGGPDSGLVILDSLNLWRQKGWTAAGQHYDIHAFASVDWKNHPAVEYCIMLLRGAYAGVQLPNTAQSQVGQVWDVVGNPASDPDSMPGSWGGHCIYLKSWNATGPVCITWGAPQQMTWAFWDTYCDESFGVIDDRDSWVDPANDPLDMTALDALLNEIEQTPPEPVPVPPAPPTPPTPVPPAPKACCNNGKKASALMVNAGVNRQLILKIPFPEWLSSRVSLGYFAGIVLLIIQNTTNLVPVSWMKYELDAGAILTGIVALPQVQKIAKLKTKLKAQSK